MQVDSPWNKSKNHSLIREIIMKLINNVSVFKATGTIGQVCDLNKLDSIIKINIKTLFRFKVTEQEVVNGIILSKNNVDHTFAFIREIRNINIKLFQHSAKYIDINMAEKKVDQEAVDLLNLLKNVKVSGHSLCY